MACVTEVRPVPALAWVVAAAVLLTPAAALLATGPLELGMGRRTALGLVVSLVLAPVLEELVMRPLLQRGMAESLLRRGLRPWVAALGAASAATLVFALVHLPAWSLAGVRDCAPWLVPGAALAATWCWRQRTLDCVLLHAFFNTTLWLVGVG